MSTLLAPDWDSWDTHELAVLARSKLYRCTITNSGPLRLTVANANLLDSLIDSLNKQSNPIHEKTQQQHASHFKPSSVPKGDPQIRRLPPFSRESLQHAILNSQETGSSPSVGVAVVEVEDASDEREFDYEPDYDQEQLMLTRQTNYKDKPAAGVNTAPATMSVAAEIVAKDSRDDERQDNDRSASKIEKIESTLRATPMSEVSSNLNGVKAPPHLVDVT